MYTFHKSVYYHYNYIYTCIYMYYKNIYIHVLCEYIVVTVEKVLFC